MDSIKLKEKAYAMKLKILELAHNAFPNGVHIGSAMSAAEILAVLSDIANLCHGSDRDRIILSKAHGALSLYTALWQSGKLSEDILMTYDKDGARLSVHPERNLELGLETSGGSLGLGISYAVGQAQALKLSGSPAKVYCIVGDGELDEGIAWEALMCASNYKLNNLIVTIDNNNEQIDGPTECVMALGDIKAKLDAFGFETVEVDGHNIKELSDVYSLPCSDRPRAIIAHTVKGHGVDFLTGTKESHYCSLSAKKYEKAVEQIKQAYGYGI